MTQQNLATKAVTFEDAVFEAKAYNRLGALDDEVIRDIAFDYGVDLEELQTVVYGG